MSYLRQIIVVRKDLTMPTGKLAAMVAHASMAFIVERMQYNGPAKNGTVEGCAGFSAEEHQWLTELDPGLEDIGQVSFAKIVCAVDSLEELLKVESDATNMGLCVHRVVDSGHSHNPAGALTCIAIGPDWPDKLEPVTGKLKVYR